MRNKTDTTHWADKIAQEVIQRVENNEQLKKVVADNKYGFMVYDEKTPSGKIHIGSARGWVIHDVIAKALRAKGVKSVFVLSSDDMDPFDKMNSDLPADYEKYLGMPFIDMPSPVDGYKNFADYYFSQCTDKFKEFGIDCELESTAEQYRSGAFNKTIKIALDNSEAIKKIYSDMYGDESTGANRIPFNPVCEKCGKIGTTVTTAWDSDKEEITYECRPDFVKWAKGCGHKGTRSPYNGGGKFPWKVEWAAKWPTKGVIVETAGKDHFTKGGSRTIACKIAVDIFKYPPPHPSNGYGTGPGYEFFTVGGKKMSTSKGFGMGFVDSTNYVPAHILRFLLVRSRPTAVIDFQPYDSNDLILLYDRFDKMERVYFGKEEVNEKEKAKLTRLYELSHIGDIPKEMPVQIGFTHCSMLVQAFPDKNIIIENLKKTDHIGDISDYDKEHILARMEFARRWVEEFAPEQYRFKLQDKVPASISLSDGQKKGLSLIAKTLQDKDWEEKELYNEIYRIAREECSIEPKELFSAAYSVLLNKERGPRLAGFLLAVKERAVELFNKV